MKIQKIKIENLKPYDKNVKIHTKKQIEDIIKSIKEFGFNDPIAVWGEDNLIVEGHGRLEALKQMGVKEAPCIRLDHLTDEQRKAYTLVHNKLTMDTSFDFGLLEEELQDISFDLVDFDFKIPQLKEFHRVTTVKKYKLDILDEAETEGYYDMPIIKRTDFIPTDLIGFNYMLTSEEKKVGLHTFLDDYQFERLWSRPDEYLNKIKEYECILSPDFSLYLDMPMAMKIWNVYRSRLLGQYFQKQGVEVIPTVSWAEEETFEFCFDGIEQGSTVAISTVGVKQSKDRLQFWANGVDEMIRVIQPETILVYGGKVDYDFGDINIVYYDNKITEKWKNKGGKSE